MMVIQLNWLAIASATFAYYVLGALWFGPLCGRLYDRALELERSRNQKWPPMYYIVPLASSFTVAVATAALSSVLPIGGFRDAWLLGLVFGIGYAVPISFTNAVNPKTPHPLLYAAVTGSYHLVGILIVATIVFAWR